MSSTVIRFFPPAPPPEPLKRISVEQYHAIIRAGVFDDDDPLELLDGWLVGKMPKKPPHSVATGLLSDALAPLLPPGWHIISQEPITTDDSEPEPDIGAVRGKRRDYIDAHPGPKDVGFIVEVADRTMARDRGVKKTIYARARIPIYWIVTLLTAASKSIPIPPAPRILALTQFLKKNIGPPLKDSIIRPAKCTSMGNGRRRGLCPGRGTGS